MSHLDIRRLMIIAGESSGELYGAFLAKSIMASFPGARIIGVGGDRMAEAGVDLISRISSSFGIVEVIRTYRALRNTFRKAVDALTTFKPQLLVLIDYPDFNLRLAAEAKKKGIKVLYYVSPQVWAWRKGRIYSISRTVDKMAVILPFEVAVYRETGLSCEFVGHPVMDEIREIIGLEGFDLKDVGSPALKASMKLKLGVDPAKPVLTIMPGSRRHEISRLLPVLSQAITELQKRYSGYQYIIPVAPNIDKDLFKNAALPEECFLIPGKSIEGLAAADAGVIASGTSTLQAAFLGVPMTVVYKLSPLTLFIGRLIIKVKYVSLVNLLLEKSATDETGLRVKELLQDDASLANIVSEISKIIDDRSYREQMLLQLSKVRELYTGRSASARVAEMIGNLINE
jgi:lipid-A-disaccharide synthase